MCVYSLKKKKSITCYLSQKENRVKLIENNNLTPYDCRKTWGKWFNQIFSKSYIILDLQRLKQHRPNDFNEIRKILKKINKIKICTFQKFFFYFFSPQFPISLRKQTGLAEVYVFASREKLNAEGFKDLTSSRIGMGGTDTRSRQDAGLDDSSGNALRHFSCSNESKLVCVGGYGEDLHGTLSLSLSVRAGNTTSHPGTGRLRDAEVKAPFFSFYFSGSPQLYSSG